MAVGGMIGGGIYTLAGVILGVAGPLAWVSLLLGSVLALITVRSYFCLTLEVEREGVILAALALIGFWRWNPENLVSGVPAGNLTGVFIGMAATFIAFEGFEMLAYDLRELRCPQQVMRKALPLAVIAVALAYSVVTVGAASLVGAGVLVEQKENALAVAGAKAGGTGSNHS